MKRQSATRTVAPLAGAWVEITMLDEVYKLASVAPLAGAWVEIDGKAALAALRASLPSRERGLKCKKRTQKKKLEKVAPLAGAWVEICEDAGMSAEEMSRSPRGSVG